MPLPVKTTFRHQEKRSQNRAGNSAAESCAEGQPLAVRAGGIVRRGRNSGLALSSILRAALADILGQSSTLWILLFSVVFLRERVSRRNDLAAVLALAGVLLVTRG
jgi:hypothetical protein